MKILILAAFLSTFAVAQDFISAEKPFSKERLTGGNTVLGLPSSPGGLLDPSRFSMHQSYSMNYWSSGNNSDMTGLYLNRLQYDFRIPLTLQVDIGVFHRPLALINNESSAPGTENQTMTIPRVGLTYQPTKNLFMAFEYYNIPAGYSSGFGPDPFSPFPTARRGMLDSGR